MSLFGHEAFGSFEELHRKCRDVMPIPFHGLKLSVAKTLGSHFQVHHAFTIPAVAMGQGGGGYRFGATFVGRKEASPGEVYPVMHSETDVAGNVRAHLMQLLGKKYRVKFQGCVVNDVLDQTAVSVERRSPSTSYEVVLTQPNFLDRTGIFSASYLRKFTDKLAVGAEVTIQSNDRLPGGYWSAINYAIRASEKGGRVATLSTDGAQVHGTYYCKQSDQMKLGVEFNGGPRGAFAAMGYQFDSPDHYVIRGQLDTNWTAASVVEKRFGKHSPYAMSLSVAVDLPSNQASAGVGFSVGGLGPVQ